MSEFYQKLFGEKYLNRNLKLDLNKIANLDFIKQSLTNWYKRIDTREIFTKSEKELQPSFYSTIFTNVLGYKDPENMIPEKSTEQDGTKPDASLGFYMNGSITRVVVEMKDANTDLDKKQNRKGDNRTPVEQAFGYVGKQNGNCRWVIVSNFVELRLYSATDQSKYQFFNLKDIATDETKLRVFLELLSKENLISENSISSTEDLFKKREEEDKEITNKFYKEYKQIRIELYNHIKDNNPSIDEITVLNKTQKILDRIIFVCFCEDLRLMPHKTLKKVLESVKQNIYDRSDTKIWNSIKALFDSIDKGNPAVPINRFNGGLFKEDEVLNNLIIKDTVLEHIIKIEEQDFESELNVNILGHIFEQSISDLEELKASIEGAEFDTKKGKRKKDGVFYTPEYITRYIVDQAIGGWLEDRKQELGFNSLAEFEPEDYAKVYADKVRKNSNLEKKRNVHLKLWISYRESLFNIKVCDPACGSGSFLVQVFDYLRKEGQIVNEEISKLQGRQTDLFNFDKHILSNNIYGVDINRESVEITKLALWLKTANKTEPLTSLDENIKCGNSLIDDAEVAGDLAFDWKEKYKDIMANGGFDVIVGNPPYVDMRGMNNTSIKYSKENYYTAGNRVNTFALFVEKSYQLQKENSTFGMIIHRNLIRSNEYEKCRELILENSKIKQILSFANGVFDNVVGEMTVLITKKTKDTNNQVEIFNFDKEIEYNLKGRFLSQKQFHNSIGKRFNIYLTEKIVKILKKLEQQPKKFKDIALTKQGIIAKSEKHDISDKKLSEIHKAIFRGKDISKYSYKSPKEYIRYDPLVLTRSRKKENFEQKEKILTQHVAGKIIATLDTKSIYYMQTINGTYSIDNNFNNYFLLSLLNSKVLNFYYSYVFNLGAEFTTAVAIDNIDLLPIPKITKAKQAPFIEKAGIMLAKNKELSKLSNKFLLLLKSDFSLEKTSKKLSIWYEMNWNDLYKELKKQKVSISTVQKEEWFDRLSRMGNEAKQIKSIIDDTDREIDKMVYKLYNLTDNEIKIVEGE